MFEDILTFWFDELTPAMWWKKDAALDDEIKRRFLPVLERASVGELFEWRQHYRSALAEVIVLDQFSRNIFRDTPMAFANDPLALSLSQNAVEKGFLESLPDPERGFLLLPFMHSESRAIHEVALQLYTEFVPGNLDFEIKHKAIIDRFGRYPHRNDILGRVSSAEELEFLSQPGSSF